MWVNNWVPQVRILCTLALPLCSFADNSIRIGESVTRGIARGEIHKYRIVIPAQHRIRVRLRQVEIDTWVEIKSGEDNVVGWNASPWGTESYTFLTGAEGPVHIEVHAASDDAKEGRYTLHVAALRPISPTDRRHASAQANLTRALALPRDESSVKLLQQSLQQTRTTMDPVFVGHCERLLAARLHITGWMHQAVTHAHRAATLWRQTGDRDLLWDTYRELATSYGRIQEYGKSSYWSRAANRLAASSTDRRILSVLRKDAGMRQRNAGQLAAARKSLQQSYDLSRAIGDEDAATDRLEELTKIAMSAGDIASAVGYAEQFLRAQASPHAVREAVGHSLLGNVLRAAGRNQEAIHHLQISAAIRRMLGDWTAELETRLALCDVYLSLGDYDQALRNADWIDRIANIAQARLPSPKWQARMVSNALAGNGRIRAGILLRRQMGGSSGPDALHAFLSLDIARAWYLSETRATLAEVRTGLLDTDTVLLHYEDIRDRVYVWVLRHNALDVTELPIAKDHLATLMAANVRHLLARQAWPKGETLAARLARLRREDTQFRVTSRQLSAVLLQPIAGFIAGKRLVINSDALGQQIPFAALPDPSHPADPLLEHHEMLSLPSATAVVGMEKRRKETPATGYSHEVSVFADPVFEASDPRFHADARHPITGMNPRSALRSVRADHFVRLIRSRWEAERIRATVKDARLFLDFDANRLAIISNQFGAPRILHFATHGLSDPRSPDRSGLALSSFNAAGQKQPTMVSFGDIDGLALRCELVVLSACETAAGRAYAGEGILSLGSMFLKAGAKRVLSSQWKIDDEATTALMERFYVHHLGDRRPVSAALRAAQLDIAKQPRWASPYYWGGFVLQGMWK